MPQFFARERIVRLHLIRARTDDLPPPGGLDDQRRGKGTVRGGIHAKRGAAVPFPANPACLFLEGDNVLRVRPVATDDQQVVAQHR